MTRLLRPFLAVIAAAAIAVVAGACGESKISFSTASAGAPADYAAANIFHEHCAGCHTLSYAAAYGSGNNPRTYLAISGPNFNQRCERPVTRVLYAIENGGFSGAYMPANIVVGQQAREVARFVSRFAGRDAPIQPGTTPCEQQPMGSLPPTLTGGVPLTTTSSSTSTAGGARGTSNGLGSSQPTSNQHSGQGTSTSPVLTGTSTAANYSNSTGHLSKKPKKK